MSEGRWSLRVRLAGGFALVALVTLSGTALFLHGALHRQLLAEDAAMLSGELTRVREELGGGGGMEAVARRLRMAAAGGHEERVFGRLLEADGQEVAATPGMAMMVPEAEGFPEPVGEGEVWTRLSEWRTAEGRPVLLGSARVRTGEGEWEYQAAMDAGGVEVWLGESRRVLGLMAGLGTVVCGVLGLVVARRGLRPVAEITEAVRLVERHGGAGLPGDREWPEELRSLAEESDRMLRRLDESYAKLARFTADAAHELRTPLNNLMLGTGLLLSRERSGEEYRRHAERSQEQYQRLHRMVESLLFLARAEDGGAGLEVERCDAGELCGEVVEFHGAAAEAAGVGLSCRGSGEVWVDGELVKQAVGNLVSNAVEHTAPGGKVVVTVGAGEDGVVVIEVADSGCGIAAEHLGRVFDRFYRVDGARVAGVRGGAGLGLAIVAMVMRLHGGSAGVESRFGEGTVMTLRFPAGGGR